MQAKPILAAKPNQKTDRGHLRLVRTRAQPRCVLPPVILISAWKEILGQLRVDQQRQASPGKGRRRGLEFLRLDHGQTFNAGIDQEAFEASHACCRQRRNVFLVLPRQSTPGHPIYAALPGGRIALGFERGDRGGLGQAIERHIDQRGVAPGRGGAGSGGEAFPFRAARFVYVHVRIHQAGQQHPVAE